MNFIRMGLLDYFTVEDESGRIKIWYNISHRRCPPRLKSELTITGKVVASGRSKKLLFVASSISVDAGPELAKNEVRMCQLCLQEVQIHAEEGPEGLKECWKSQGKPDRVLVYD